MTQLRNWIFRLSGTLVRAWYRPKISPLLIPLLPLSALVVLEARRRLQAFRKQPPRHPMVPVVVVGNITAGGTGKTPLVAELVERLREKGYRPGVISRGYGSSGEQPRRVTSDSDPMLCGDEPVMLAGLTGVPVVVGADRTRAVGFLLESTDCNLIVSDDGLQHFRLARHIEIVVVDGQRLFGNGRCLPVGPLREPIERLQSVDFIVCNGQPDCLLPKAEAVQDAAVMTLESAPLRPVDPSSKGAPPQVGDTVHGVAGIGNPERFFQSLRAQGLSVTGHAFADHHPFSRHDLSFLRQGAVIMTAKDAVKCRAFAEPHWWYLPVRARLPESFWCAFFARLQSLPEFADC